MRKPTRFLLLVAFVLLNTGCAEPIARPPVMVTYGADYWSHQDCATVPTNEIDVCRKYHGQAEARAEKLASRGGVPDWASVPCDVVVEDRRADCVAEHERLGIGPNITAPPSNSSNLTGLAQSSCGYASNGYRPIVDTDAIEDPNRFECDLAACQSYASRIDPAANAAGGAVTGALIGAAIGALVGDRGSFARYGAGVGAVQGGVAAGAGSLAAQANVVRNCMVGRGYRVLQ